MSDMMTFPATVEEFMEQYKIVDDEKVYTNGADLVPIFRMMQWFEHVSAKDTISRQAAIDALEEGFKDATEGVDKLSPTYGLIKAVTGIYKCLIGKLPSAQPERTCVNCGRTVNNGGWYADGGTRCPIEEHYALPKDGYCYLWEKRNVTDDNYPKRREE